MEEKYAGKSIFKGVAIGRIMIYGKKEQPVKREKIEDTDAEVRRYEAAKEKAIADLGELYEDAVKKVGKDNAEIFNVHAMLLQDDDFNDSIHNMIESQKVNAEYAAAVTGENFSKMFAEMDDDYFKARSADMKDIAERLVKVLSGREDKTVFDQPVIIAADDLMPSETVQLDKEHVRAKKPDIIILQLESFIDIGRVRGVNTDIESIPNFKAFEEEYPSGWLTVPAIGAGTANTEFEIITGMKSKLFGAGEYPYKTVLTTTPCESMAQVLKRRYSYGTHAIHNNKAKFYSRDISYANLGFETFTSLEYMYDVNRTQTGWAKDDCLPAEIFKALDSDEQQDFILCISVQGHGRYPTKELKCEEHVKVTLDSGDPELTNQFGYFVNQCYEMDQMILELKNMLDERDKPYVLVLYGDHIPALTFEEDQFERGEQNQTEYVIVNNIGLEMEDRDIYTYELSDYLMSALGMKRGIMQRCHEEYFDPEIGDDSEFKDVANLIQYDMLYGDKYIFDRIRPYEATDMKLGIDDIVVDDVEFDDATGNILVRGQNFTPFSKILINDERTESFYVDRETLMIVAEDVAQELVPGDVIEVAQIDKDRHELTRTPPFVYGGEE